MNLLTVDVEEINHANFPLLSSYPFPSTVEEGVNNLLHILKTHRVKATFFILGEIARSFPEMVRRISQEGHEIASHGMRHRLVYEMEEEEFREDIRDSRRILEEISGQRIKGYRAPSWSVSRNTLWVFRVLKEEGFLYDSSIFPFTNFLYGMEGFPPYPFKFGEVWEIPPSTLTFFPRRIPVGGGFYFRILPLALLFLSMEWFRLSGNPFVLYLHSWEFAEINFPLPYAPLHRFILSAGLGSVKRKLERILDIYIFSPVTDFIQG